MPILLLRTYAQEFACQGVLTQGPVTIPGGMTCCRPPPDPGTRVLLNDFDFNVFGDAAVGSLYW